MKRPLALVSVVVALAAGFAIGNWFGGVRGADAALAERARAESLQRMLDEALAKAARPEASAEPRRRSDPVPASGNTPQPPTGEGTGLGGDARPPVGVVDPAPAGDADAQARGAKVAALLEGIDGHFETGNGEEVLSVLRKLAEIVPEGRSAAMALAIRVNDDVRGEGALGLGVQTFYMSLGDSAVRDLMVWSLSNESPPGFRVMSSYSLPWVLPREQAIQSLAETLQREKDVSVQSAIVANLVQMNDHRAEAALTALFADRQRDPSVRAQIAVNLAVTEDESFRRALEDAARDDPDERVRSASRTALIARTPPVDGYMITSVTPESAAASAGVLSGDILVTYDGAPARSIEQIRAAIAGAAGRDGGVQIVVYRGSGEVTLTLPRGGPMGIVGRSVRRK